MLSDLLWPDERHRGVLTLPGSLRPSTWPLPAVSCAERSPAGRWSHWGCWSSVLILARPRHSCSKPTGSLWPQGAPWCRMEWDWSGRSLRPPPPPHQPQHTGVCLEQEKLKQYPGLAALLLLSLFILTICMVKRQNQTQRMQLRCSRIKIGNTDFIYFNTFRTETGKREYLYQQSKTFLCGVVRPILFSYLNTRWKTFSTEV